MSYALEIQVLEPCEDCGKTGSYPVRLMYDEHGEVVVILCDACHEERRAAKERAKLAEWGTLGQKRRGAA